MISLLYLTPKIRAVVLSEVSEFIRKGRNVFCKHVVDIDSSLRPNDEVIVVNQNNDLLAIGKLVIPVPYIRSFQTGIALKIRRGIGKSKLAIEGNHDIRKFSRGQRFKQRGQSWLKLLASLGLMILLDGDVELPPEEIFKEFSKKEKKLKMI